MIDLLYQWLDRRRALRDKAAYDRGWCWAAGALLHGRTSDEVMAEVDTGMTFDHTPFDDGAAAAVRAWEASEYRPKPILWYGAR